jgi:hypothetical protein
MTQDATDQATTKASPAPSRTVIQRGDAGSAVYTVRDLEMLKARRSQLSDQLTSAVGRRNSVQKQLVGAVGADKAGLEQRLGVLDTRIARIESEIDETGRTLASPEAAGIALQRDAQWTPVGRIAENATPILIVFTLFVLMPIAVSMSRLLWKRAAQPTRATAITSETAQRLERMEQAMDAIAVEMERVSEGQRFVTRILTEGRSEAVLGAGAASQPARVSASEGLSTAR